MRKALWLTTALFGLHATAEATPVTFNQDPFAGSTALTTPGRQVIAGEISTTFAANDVFQFDAATFGVNSLYFANGEIGSIPAQSTNLAVLRTFDNDANPATPFGAGNAANLLADQITTDGAGFFIYFNSGLDLARLVFSTNLSDATADLKILARFTDLNGQAGRDAMANISARNFAITGTNVPEPGTLVLMGIALAAGLGLMRRRQVRSEAVLA